MGWQFSGWTGGVADANSNETTVVMNGDKIVTANFNQTIADLTMSVYGSGSVTPSFGSHSYSLGELVDITATPATNWDFVNWIGDVDNPSLPTTNVTMDTNQTVTANFTRVNSVLRTLTNGSGSVTPEGSNAYPIGELVDLVATPAANWEFASWSGDADNITLASTNITMNWDKIVTANFNRTHGTLSIAASGGGSITPESGDHTYAVGTVVDITASPASGWGPSPRLHPT